jgi:hypothetical protein
MSAGVTPSGRARPANSSTEPKEALSRASSSVSITTDSSSDAA